MTPPYWVLSPMGDYSNVAIRIDEPVTHCFRVVDIRG